MPCRSSDDDVLWLLVMMNDIFKNADVNGDKKVNAADIVILVNMIKEK